MEVVFFTVVTERRQKLFVNEMNVDILRQAFRYVMNKRVFVIDATVILPDHIHFAPVIITILRFQFIFCPALTKI